MEASAPRVLVIANQTAATPALVGAVRERAGRGPCDFTLLVPALADIPAADFYANRTLELALPLLREAAGGPVRGVVGEQDPWHAVDGMLAREHFDEVILSTLPEPVSEWLRRDLPSRIKRRGVPVTVIKAPSH